MKAKTIMIQGTMSNSGKSFLVAALCRIFSQDGYRTAPFKSQNMALNSYITKEGLEMGRAQVMQAEAAGIEPSVHMNPILLKPTGHMGSQVIVGGEVLGNLGAMDYYRRKPEFIPEILKSFHKLESEYDMIVLEGAGSPAEINLRDNDIVNMGMAKMAKAPVLLVGDIDRGGVFASLYGTVALLEKEEQTMIKGLIINKFRGDRRILEPGLNMIEDKLNIPVTGVIPMGEIDLEDEDSLSERFTFRPCSRPSEEKIRISVVHLPHISNFTDFHALEQVSAVELRYVKKAEQITDPDLIILPGTKNTMADLLWVRETGMEEALLELAAKHIPILGICGGYQMLGKMLHDPEQVEQGGSLRGLGLLDAETVFSRQKTRTRISGKLHAGDGIFKGSSGMEVSGYEIHMGRTNFSGKCKSADFYIALEDGRNDGMQSDAGMVYGTYLHGLFDNRQLTHCLLANLAGTRDIRIDVTDPELYKQEQFDKLASLVRNSLDMKAVYEIVNQGI